MKDKIELWLEEIRKETVTNLEGIDETRYEFIGDRYNGELQCSYDATVEVLGQYFEQLEKQKELVLDILEKKAREQSITYDEGMQIIGILSRAVENLERINNKEN